MYFSRGLNLFGEENFFLAFFGCAKSVANRWSFRRISWHRTFILNLFPFEEMISSELRVAVVYYRNSSPSRLLLSFLIMEIGLQTLDFIHNSRFPCLFSSSLTTLTYSNRDSIIYNIRKQLHYWLLDVIVLVFLAPFYAFFLFSFHYSQANFTD